MYLNINSNAAVKFTNVLEQMHRSALPVAVRGALNDAAFDVKTNTMPSKASAAFVNRSKNFFKANSRFKGATGYNVNTMVATVGFVETGLNGGNNYAVKDLEQQEEGGTIGGRSFKPMKDARVGGVNTGLVKPNYRLSKIEEKVKLTSRNMKGKNWAQKAILTSVAAGKGGFVLDDHVGKGVLWRVDSIGREGKNIRFKRTALYSFSKGGKAKVHKTAFMEGASMESAAKLERFFIEQAKRKINGIRI